MPTVAARVHTRRVKADELLFENVFGQFGDGERDSMTRKAHSKRDPVEPSRCRGAPVVRARYADFSAPRRANIMTGARALRARETLLRARRSPPRVGESRELGACELPPQEGFHVRIREP